MSIALTCACGKALKVRDEAAGKTIKCPGCKASLQVPAAGPPAAAEIDLLPEPAPAAAPEPQGPPPPEPRQPERLPHAGPKDFEHPPIFPLMALGMVYRPWYILEYFRGWAQRPAVLIQVVLLFVGSLAALSAVAAAGYIGPRRSEPAAPDATTAADEDERTAFVKALPKLSGVQARISPEHPRAGDDVRLRVAYFVNNGKQQPVRVSGTVSLKPGVEWEFDEEEPPPPPPATPAPPAPEQPLRFERDAKSGWEVCTFTPKEAGVARFTIQGDPAWEGQPFSFNVYVMARANEPEAPPVAAKAITATTRLVFTLLASLIAIAINAFVINLATKVFGEGGDFLFLAVVLAFVQSIVNLGQLALLAIGPAVSPETQFLLQYPFGLWEFALTLLAIMKVYEFDLGAALLTSAVASLIKMWGVGVIVGAMMGLG